MIGQCPGCGAYMLTRQMLERGGAGCRVRVCSASCGARVCGLPPRNSDTVATKTMERWFAMPSPDESR